MPAASWCVPSARLLAPAAGAASLANGTAALAAGAKSLADGTHQLAAGMPALAGGVTTLSAAAAGLADGAAADGVGRGMLAAGTAISVSGAKTLAAAVGQAADGATVIQAETGQLGRDAGALATDAQGAASSLDSAAASASTYPSGTRQQAAARGHAGVGRGDECERLHPCGSRALRHGTGPVAGGARGARRAAPATPSDRTPRLDRPAGGFRRRPAPQRRGGGLLVAGLLLAGLTVARPPELLVVATVAAVAFVAIVQALVAAFGPPRLARRAAAWRHPARCVGPLAARGRASGAACRAAPAPADVLGVRCPCDDDRGRDRGDRAGAGRARRLAPGSARGDAGARDERRARTASGRQVPHRRPAAGPGGGQAVGRRRPSLWMRIPPGRRRRRSWRWISRRTRSVAGP